MNTLLTTTQASAASVGEVDGSNVYYGGGGGGRAGTPISQAGGAGGSGVVILKYPSNYTIGGGSGLTIHTPSSPPSGYTLKVFTAGTGTVSWS